MSDPQPANITGDGRAPAASDREARIEQLLLSGLDHYFAGNYEQAINIWTRVAFLERGHRRARAYIERARGALAERHRESEELLHQGVAAFNRGDTDAARALITRAADEGAPQDVALVLLERLNRLGIAPAASEPPRSAPLDRRRAPTEGAPTARRSAWWVRAAAVAAVAGGIGGALFLSEAPLPGWLGDSAASPQAHVPAPSPEALPVAHSSERVIARARSLQAGGHLRDALDVLAAVPQADALRAEADRLRAEVQRQLLKAGRAAYADVRSSSEVR